MKQLKSWMLNVILIISGTIVLTASCFNGSNAAKNGQLLEVYDVHGSEATARLTVNGKVLFTTSVYIGKNGIGKEGEGDSKTPIGEMHVLNAFGVKPNPGTTIPYIDVTNSIYACDDQCEYYNQIIDTAAVHHKCGGEDMFHIVPEYNYGIATDFNKECIWPNGSNIFIHCKGHKTWTGGCIALDEERMVELLKNCDQSLVITVSE
jgi:L,D-peptidoglycan transpeptidase YkuD (ErfK/YbiS/YcfS/YnhG family)